MGSAAGIADSWQVVLVFLHGDAYIGVKQQHISDDGERGERGEHMCILGRDGCVDVFPLEDIYSRILSLTLAVPARDSLNCAELT